MNCKMEEALGGNAAALTINGKVCFANQTNSYPHMSLNEFIRDVAKFKGNKFMCEEGGCGACVVTVQATHPVTKKEEYFPVNSCLFPVLKCHGMAITTTEGLGNKAKGYHQIQKTLAKFNGTQCGYCSPGMVMNMHSLMKSWGNDLTMAKIEDAFGGHICRCTGYRPILDAFKSMAKDASDDLKNKFIDIEDCAKKCSKMCISCPEQGACHNKDDAEEDEFEGEIDFIETALAPKTIKISFGENQENWFKVGSVREIMELFDMIGAGTYTLVGGHTAQGVHKPKVRPTNYIDINDVIELKTHTVGTDLIQLGANMTLNEAHDVLAGAAKENQLMFGYGKVLAKHIKLVANEGVRSTGTLAGNLMIKHEHNDFPSDIFLLLETSGAVLTILDITGMVSTVSMPEFLTVDMRKKVIVKITLPAISSMHYVMKTYKIMARKQNVYAHVNAGFQFRLDYKTGVVLERPKIIFGGIHPKFIHAQKSETFWTGKSLLHPITLKLAMGELQNELNAEVNPPMASPEYRRQLACSLFYRFILKVYSAKVDPKFKSGGYNLRRPLSSGRQDLRNGDGKDKWPVGKPVNKIEGLIQCSGEAEYVNDIPEANDELHAALVITDRAAATIVSIDPKPALEGKGVVAFFSAKDIPGQNTFIFPSMISTYPEEVFSSGKVLYAGQPVGIIVATNREIALEAAKHVKITYGSTSKPLLTIKEVIAKGDKTRIMPVLTIPPKRPGGKFTRKVTGEFETAFQYHYSMEMQVCRCVPNEYGMKVYPSTQWMQSNQYAVSQVLNISENKVQVEVKRVGGAFGCKITRSALVSAACALAAYKLNKPVRLVLDMPTTMKSIGRRSPQWTKYEVGVDDKGTIQYGTIDMYSDYGCEFNEDASPHAKDGIQNIYDSSTWKIAYYGVKTDNASSVSTRAPGSVEAMAAIEQIMEHIAFTLGKTSLDVRLSNANKDETMILKMIKTISESSDYKSRAASIETFNKGNRWKKRGISLIPMKFPIIPLPGHYSMVSIYSDGSVVVTIGGIEIGQGINTKAAQVCAHNLGVDLENVTVMPSQNITAPGSILTGGSQTSDGICKAVIQCCNKLNERLGPLKKDNPAWKAVIIAAVTAGIQLSEVSSYRYIDSETAEYSVYGATVLEAELDALTGKYQILRADILEDVGQSLSPYVDLGQVEGAFVMGLGLFTSEEMKFDPITGQNLTYRSWTYWPPGAKDIPIDFRVSFEKDSSNPRGVYSSKATGEPALCMSVAFLFALRDAIRSARLDAGLPDEWFTFYPPCTVEKTFLTTGTDPKAFSAGVSLSKLQNDC